MTQEDVDLIYNYLHENYEYIDGNLIKKENKSLIIGHLDYGSKKLVFMYSFIIKNKRYHWAYSHLVYFYHNKIKPEYILNINGSPADNRIENLRPINHCQMMNKCDLRVKNKHGYKGVVQDNKRFGARLWTGKSYKYISWHKSAEEAHEAYLKAKQEYAKN